MEALKRKLNYIYLQTTLFLAYAIAWTVSWVCRRRQPATVVHRIAAVWYYPPDLTGSNLRLGAWRPFFLRDGYDYENFYVSSLTELRRDWETGTWPSRYAFLRRVVWARLPVNSPPSDCSLMATISTTEVDQNAVSSFQKIIG